MIYFASDVHLGSGSKEEQRAIEQRFLAWLDMVAQDADSIILMGDIFDFWFEYKRVIPQGYTRVLGRLAELTDKGIKVVFIAGNHDMWVRDYLPRECGVELHTKPLSVELYGKHLFLAHGDNMRVKPFTLLWLMNSCFRSNLLRWLFRWLIHPDIAMKFGRWWSGKSRKSHSRFELKAEITNPLYDYAREHHKSHPEIDYYIFGHMHIAVDRLADSPGTLHLGCWDGSTPTYARLDKDGRLSLETFTL